MSVWEVMAWGALGGYLARLLGNAFVYVVVRPLLRRWWKRQDAARHRNQAEARAVRDGRLAPDNASRCTVRSAATGRRCELPDGHEGVPHQVNGENLDTWVDTGDLWDELRG